MKYREIGDFHEYYSGRRKAPYLTLFVGGNHEASNHLFELYYGGWVAPNIYYLGAAGVVHVGPLRVAGLSGIWKGYNYNRTHYERLPYNQDDIRSIYHVRELDVRKLLQVRSQVDIGISHDWPRGVEWMGDWKALFSKKDLFEADARAGTLGSSAAKYVMDRLRPPHWISAHLHCKFAAVVDYDNDKASSSANKQSRSTGKTPASNGMHNADQISLDLDDIAAPLEPDAPQRNTDEIDIDMDDEDSPCKLPKLPSHSIGSVRSVRASATPVVSEDIRALLPASFARPVVPKPPPTLPFPESIYNKTTRFLALDKCLPNRKFLQILEIEPASRPTMPSYSRPYRLSYDKEWLAITRVFASDFSLGSSVAPVPPNKGEAHYLPMIEAEEDWVEQNIVAQGNMIIPENFEITAPVFDSATDNGTMEQPKEYTNPQTVRFCKLLNIVNPFDLSEEERAKRMQQGPGPETQRTDGDRGGSRGRGGRTGRVSGGGRRRGRGRAMGYR